MDRDSGPRVPEQRVPAQRVPAPGGAVDLRFSVLGPVRAWQGGQPLSTGSPQQRALLCALLLREGRTATATELIDAIWEDDPPPQALAALRTYASRLRKALGANALVSEAGGYAIRIQRDAVDLFEARELALDAEKTRAAGDLAGARALIGKSLGLWDGEPLAHVPGPYAENHRARLDEWRLQLLETRLDLDLEAGCHSEAVSELTALTAAHPLRERFRELLMVALYRSGRQAEALAVYADTRRLLADELGVDPCPELSQLQQRILRADEELNRPGGREAPAPRIAQPAQLPATVPDFTGRASFVRDLGTQLAAPDGPVMAVSALAGIGGVGKTTLAVHVAHEARPHFPDGQLYIDLQGAGARAAEPVAVLGAFLRALGTSDASMPDTLEERSALYRSTLAGRRLLVLLDNARDAAQIRPLLPGTAGCAALVTSRTRMVDLAGAQLIDLDVMSPDEALQLFTRIVGTERVRAERESALDVVAACGFLPLAIRVAASRLASRRTWTVSVLADKLADERRRLDELQAGDVAVKATFELGYGQLETDQARAFRLVGLADGPDISLAAAAALLDLPPHTTEDLLEALVDTSLLESAAPGRYRYHDLVRLYARSCAERDERPEEVGGALSRLLDFYLASAAQVYAIERPGDTLPDRLARTEQAGLTFTDRQEALDWLYSEAHCVLNCAQQATSGPGLRRAVDLLWAAKDLAESGANSKQYETAALSACRAARIAGDLHAQGRAHTVLTEVHLVAGRYEEAEEHAARAARLAARADDPAPVFWSHNNRGIIALNKSRLKDAERFFEAAIEGSRAEGNESYEASALCNYARLQLRLGRTEHSVNLARRGVELYRRRGVTLRLSNARYALGVALTEARRLGEALEELQDAQEGFEANRQRLWEGTTQFRIAQVHLAAGRPARAAQHAEQALAIGCIGGDHIRASVLMTLGQALSSLGQAGRARACWQEALTLHEASGAAEAETVRALLAPLSAA
ncbi:BTAD domain-containing putative transcriptional regulator [Streptomyces sp. NPDC000594]|uniref:AfsR/SARP family transcriptional regulator n=1 Tax=Streptomyces sp. NPDC000594 TaxID=3154261 RepID=UPI003322AD67